MIIDRKGFSRRIPQICKTPIVIFGEMHEHADRSEVYRCILTLMKYKRITLAAEELLDTIYINKDYDKYAKMIRTQTPGYIGWSDSAISFAQKYNLELYGLEHASETNEYEIADRKDAQASAKLQTDVYAEAFKIREQHFTNNILEIRGECVVCILGDSHLRSKETKELGAASYVVNNPIIQSKATIVRCPRDKREID